MKKLLLALSLIFAVLLSGCSDVIAVLDYFVETGEVEEYFTGGFFEGGGYFDDDYDDEEIVSQGSKVTDEAGYACYTAADGTTFTDDNLPYIRVYEDGYIMNINTGFGMEEVWGVYHIEEWEGLEIVTLSVDESTYELAEDEYFFKYDSSAEILTSTQQIGAVVAESEFVYREANSSGAGPSTASSEFIIGSSPIPGDDEPILRDIFKYMDDPTGFIRDTVGEQPSNNPDLTTLIMKDWYDTYLYDNYGRDSRGLYTILGYYWNDISQVEHHVSDITRGAPEELYYAGIEFFSENGAAGTTVPYDMKLSVKGIVQTGKETDIYFYKSSNGNGGFRIEIPIVIHNSVLIEEAMQQGLVSQFATQQSEAFSVVDIENNIIMMYGKEDGGNGVYENLTIVKVSTNETEYIPGVSESATVQMNGVQLSVHESGTRILAKINTENILENVFDLK